jgi:hypothetical protein
VHPPPRWGGTVDEVDRGLIAFRLRRCGRSRSGSWDVSDRFISSTLPPLLPLLLLACCLVVVSERESSCSLVLALPFFSLKLLLPAPGLIQLFVRLLAGSCSYERTNIIFMVLQ